MASGPEPCPPAWPIFYELKYYWEEIMHVVEELCHK